MFCCLRARVRMRVCGWRLDAPSSTEAGPLDQTEPADSASPGRSLPGLGLQAAQHAQGPVGPRDPNSGPSTSTHRSTTSRAGRERFGNALQASGTRRVPGAGGVLRALRGVPRSGSRRRALW